MLLTAPPQGLVSPPGAYLLHERGTGPGAGGHTGAHSSFAVMPAPAGSVATPMVRWTNVRRRHPEALIAEDAVTKKCRAQARLWQPSESLDAWVVEVRVDCQGERPTVYQRPYRNLPAAVTNYLAQRDLTSRRVERLHN